MRNTLCHNLKRALPLLKIRGGERIVSLTLHPDTIQGILELFGNELLECFIDGQAYCDARYMADPMRFGCSPAYVEYVKTTRLPVGDMRALCARMPEGLTV